MSDNKFSDYAQPDALVSTQWVEDHLGDDSIRIVESNEDLLLYDTGHVPGAVHIDWRRDLNDQTVRISVTDTGPGIPQELHEDIFEKFRQVDGSLTRKGDGTGLGLAICRELAALLAGNISLVSQPPKGSTFNLDLPLSLPTAPRIIL